MKQVVALYDSLVFTSWNVGLELGFPIKVSFLGTFLGTENEFIKKYKRMFPNYSIQTFRGRKNPLLKSVRLQIESLIRTDPQVKQLHREIKLNNLFG